MTTTINCDYNFTSIYDSLDELNLISPSVYLFSKSPEQRSFLIPDLLKIKFPEISFLEIEQISNDNIKIAGKCEIYDLWDATTLSQIIPKNEFTYLYIDATGFSTRIFAPILKMAFNLQKKININIIYTEPKEYKIKEFKRASVYHDLAEQIDGISPIPGFASIFPDTTNFKFVVLLGFEGGRFTHLLESEQPTIDNIIPVLGVPGYRIEYPFIALWGNRYALRSTKSWNDMAFATANSIAEVYLLLLSLQKAYQNKRFKIVPIGTKPHAIGAILFALKFPKNSELLYDNPKRTVDRCNGIGAIHMTSVSELLSVS